MAATDSAAILRVPGRIVLTPTSLSAAFPYGGTSLGLVRNVVLAVRQFRETVTEEAFGRAVPVDTLLLGEVWSLTAVIRSPDQGVLQNFFLGSSTGSSTGETNVTYPATSPTAGTHTVGTWLGNSSTGVLFAPIDPMQRFVYFKRAVLMLDEAARLEMAIDREIGIPIAFLATPPASGKTVQWAPKEDISL